jgi:hypothetical protein
VNDIDVLRLARDVLKRKVTTIIKGCVGRPFDPAMAGGLVAAGKLSVVIEQLDDIADSLEAAGGE